jgi:hypothetical protein
MASLRSTRVLPPGVAHSRQSAMLIFAGLIAARLPLPYTAAAAVPLVWAGVELVLSIRDRSAARSMTRATALTTIPGSARPVSRAPARGIASSIVGLVLVSLLTMTVLLPYAFYGTVKSLQDCTLAANTAIATGDCNARYNNGLDATLRDFLKIGQRAGG